jgi:hypothetical protein
MNNRHAHHALTLVELVLALAICAMVMSALAAFSMAMGTAWKQAEQGQSVTLLSVQANLRLQDVIRNARLIGASRAGSDDESATGAAVLLWTADTNLDNYIQGDEVALIEHDTASHELRLYYTGQADGAGTWSYGTTFTADGTLDAFKVGRSYRPMMRNVYGAVFSAVNTGSSTNNPALKYGLKLRVDRTDSAGVGGEAALMVEHGMATIRAPKAAPGN